VHHSSASTSRSDLAPRATPGTRPRRRGISRQTLAKTGFTVAAGLSFLFSVSLWFSGSKQEGVFVGLWVPSILSFGTLLLGGMRDE